MPQIRRFTGGLIPTVIAPYVGPGDIVVGALAWWGLRAYNAAKAGTVAINLRRDSDNATQDFNTLTNGSLDVASITTFKGAASLFITKLYDQTGNGLHYVQATAANQIGLILSGLGALPVMRSTISPQTFMAVPAPTITQAQPFTVSWIAKRGASGGSNDYVFGQLDGNTGAGYRAFTANSATLFAGSNPIVTVSDNAFHAIQGVFNGAASDIDVDGTSNTVPSTVGTDTMTSSSALVFCGQSGGNNINADITEFGVWGSAFTATNSTNMSTNQHAYWGF